MSKCRRETRKKEARTSSVRVPQYGSELNTVCMEVRAVNDNKHLCQRSSMYSGKTEREGKELGVFNGSGF